MFLLSHLMIGLVIGILLFWYFRDPILIAACALGSILPDLIDKPLGQLVWASTIGYGRIYAHTLLFFIAILLIGIAIWWYFHSFAGIAFGLGVLFHQLLDKMWLESKNWYYPLFGPISKPTWYVTNNYITSIRTEVTNPSEWLFGLVVILILIQILQFRGNLRQKRLISAMTFVLTVILSFSGIFMLYCGVSELYCLITGWKDPVNNILAGFVIIGVVATVTSIEWKRRKE